MIKIFRLALIALLILSCNEKEKRSNKVVYPEKTTFSHRSNELNTSMKRGRLVYNNFCINCHMVNGKGATNIFPPLAQSDYLEKNQNESIIGIKNGMTGEMVVNGRTYNSVMTPLGLSDEEIADVMNYINNSWGNKYGKFLTPQDVTNVIKN